MYPTTPKIPVIINAHIGDVSQPVVITRIQGSEWKESNPVFHDDTAAEGHQCRYLLGNGRGPIHSLSFLVEITGKKWEVDRHTGEWFTRCRIIVPKPTNGAAMAETFSGKIWTIPA